MKQAPHYLKSLARQVEPAPQPEDATARRQKLIASIETSARQTRKAVQTKRRRFRAMAVVAAAAGLAAILVGARQFALHGHTDEAPRADRVQTPASSPTGDAPSAVDAASQSSAAQSALVRGSLKSETRGQLSPGDRLGEGRLTVGQQTAAILRLGSGAEIQARPRSIVRVHVDKKASLTSEWLELDGGDVSLQVPHLGTQRRLLVKTPEALVEVRGTAFRVSRKAISAQKWVTHVHVTEGLVSVRASGKEVFLGPEDSWSSSARSSAPPAPKDTAEVRTERLLPSTKATDAKAADARTAKANTAAPTGASEADRAQPTSPSSNPQATSNLAEQNRLYQSALVASRNGLSELARLRFEQLLRKYPNSPLAPGAKRELARLKPASSERQ